MRAGRSLIGTAAAPQGPTVVAAGPPITSPGGHCAGMGGEAGGVDGLAPGRPRAGRARGRRRQDHDQRWADDRGDRCARQPVHPRRGAARRGGSPPGRPTGYRACPQRPVGGAVRGRRGGLDRALHLRDRRRHPHGTGARRRHRGRRDRGLPDPGSPVRRRALPAHPGRARSPAHGVDGPVPADRGTPPRRGHAGRRRRCRHQPRQTPRHSERVRDRAGQLRSVDDGSTRRRHRRRRQGVRHGRADRPPGGGLDADLLAVEGNPAADITALRKVRLVVSRGQTWCVEPAPER